MKSKLLFIAALCAVGLNASAQTEKGKSLIVGSVIFSESSQSQSLASSKHNSFQIAPSYGYFLGNNFALGVRVRYTRGKSESSYDHNYVENGTYHSLTVTDKSTSNGYMIGPFARYYFPISDQFKFFTQVGLTYGETKSKTDNGVYIEESKYRNYSAELTPSLAFFPTKKIAIELGFNLLSYVKDDLKYGAWGTSIDKAESFKFGLSSFDPSIGISFQF